MRTGIDARLTYYRPGGITEYIRHLVRELAMLDQLNTYYILHHYKDPARLTPGDNFRRADTYTPSHHRLERWSLSAELVRFRLDLLHSPDFIPPRRGARRHLITVHDLHFLHYPQFMTSASRRYYNEHIRWAVRHADHILVDSEATRADLCEMLDVPAEKMTVHMLGVDERFRPLPEDMIESHRARLGLPDEYILFVGTFEPRKNITGLLDAYHLLTRDIPDTPPLVLAGRRGWLYDEIFAKANALKLDGRIIWHESPSADDLLAIYNGASMLVLPSFYEGFGLPILEAMACGVPTIAANRSSLPEVTGDAGLLVDPDDPGQIAYTMQTLLCDEQLRRDLREAGLARAATFTWRQTAGIVFRAYLNLA